MKEQLNKISTDNIRFPLDYKVRAEDVFYFNGAIPEPAISEEILNYLQNGSLSDILVHLILRISFLENLVGNLQEEVLKSKGSASRDEY